MDDPNACWWHPLLAGMAPPWGLDACRWISLVGRRAEGADKGEKWEEGMVDRDALSSPAFSPFLYFLPAQLAQQVALRPLVVLPSLSCSLCSSCRSHAHDIHDVSRCVRDLHDQRVHQDGKRRVLSGRTQPASKTQESSAGTMQPGFRGRTSCMRCF